MKKVICSLIIFLSLLIACNKNDDSTPQPTQIPTSEVVVEETCSDGIKNQNEEGIDCGGICSDCPLPFVEGNYKGLWNSTATNGSVYTDLKVTAIITKDAEGEYSGSLFISEDFTSCCNTPGNDGDGPLTFTIIDQKITFKWNEVNPGCIGEFNGTGIYTETNKLTLNLTGNDCEGNHTGSIEFFE